MKKSLFILAVLGAGKRRSRTDWLTTAVLWTVTALRCTAISMEALISLPTRLTMTVPLTFHSGFPTVGKAAALVCAAGNARRRKQRYFPAENGFNVMRGMPGQRTDVRQAYASV